ncbi:hypothetical protein B0T20DRAFT_49038 [Sordaria brevicollis]|uniref:PNPLA domain-containing protein n=1 Tax=Sordaria brevicollis TaxID=83679 RepID=A0AAE0P9L4_SORBR|nr:hypothetical protein B0T20DRAFT_49038 [Sordaria brevicollis]
MAPRTINGPVNLLSLDGGGVRGVSEVVMLHKIMKRVQEIEGLRELPKPCDYFHIIGGTSTGGLVAIMLGKLRMNTEEALAKYHELGKVIFRARNKNVAITRFGAKALEEAVKAIVQESGHSEKMYDRRNDEPGTTGKTFVCGVRSKNIGPPQRFRSYASKHDKKYRDCKIWQAARATSAAPTYFGPIKLTHDGVEEEFIDAAVGFNNPISEVLNEAGLELDPNLEVGCILSLGCGTRPRSLKAANAIPGSGIILLVRAGVLMKQMLTDPEKDHYLIETRMSEFDDTYFRLSVPNGAVVVGLADYKKMQLLQQMTEEYLDTDEVSQKVEKVARILAERKSQRATVGTVCILERGEVQRTGRKARPMGMPSTFFTGRTHILQKMERVFFTDEARRSRRFDRREYLLWGMGGIGKTQIALRFAQKHEDRFDHIFWVDATDRATAEQSYHGIAMALGIQQKTSEESQARVLEWMGASDRNILLLFDNYAHNGYGEDNNIVPTRGNIIYSSRSDSLRLRLGQDAVSEVLPMEEADAITLLLRRLYVPPENPQEREICIPAVKDLGYMPLAIEQAGALMFEGNLSIYDFMKDFQEKKDLFLRNPEYKQEGDPAVYVTFDMSFDYLRTQSRKEQTIGANAEDYQNAIKILSMVGFYHNEGITEEMVMRAAEWRARKGGGLLKLGGKGKYNIDKLIEHDECGNWDPTWFRRAANILRQLSLVRLDQDRSMSMHVLVHSWARERLSESERAAYGLSARSILFESIPEGISPEETNFRCRLLPHGLAITSLVEQRWSDPVLESSYDERWAKVNEDTGRYAEVERCLKSALWGYKVNFTLDNQRCIDVMIRLAELYNQVDTRRWVESEALLTECLARQEFLTFRKLKVRQEPRGRNGKMVTVEEKWEKKGLREVGAQCSQFIIAKRQLADFYRRCGMWDLRRYLLEEIKEDILESGLDSDLAYLQPPDADIIEAKNKATMLANKLTAQEIRKLDQENDEARAADAEKYRPADEEEIDTMVRSKWRKEIVNAHDNDIPAEEKYRLLMDHYQETLDIYGPNSKPTLAALVEGLAVFALREERGGCALIVLREAIRRSAERFSDTHPDTVIFVSQLVDGLNAIGRSKEALKLSCVVQNLFHEQLGEKHEYTFRAAQVVEYNTAFCKNFLQVERDKASLLARGDIRGHDELALKVLEATVSDQCPVTCTAASHAELYRTLKQTPRDPYADTATEDGYMTRWQKGRNRSSRETEELVVGLWDATKRERLVQPPGREMLTQMVQVA